MSMLRLEQLGKRYPRAERPSLTEFDLVVERGDFVGIVGESGSGKTTVLRLVAGFEEPTTGTIAIGSQIVSSDNIFAPAEVLYDIPTALIRPFCLRVFSVSSAPKFNRIFSSSPSE